MAVDQDGEPASLGPPPGRLLLVDSGPAALGAEVKGPQAESARAMRHPTHVGARSPTARRVPGRTHAKRIPIRDRRNSTFERPRRLVARTLGVMNSLTKIGGLATAALLTAGFGAGASAPASALNEVTSSVSILSGTTPVIPLNSDTASVELGVKFVPLVSGQVTAIRFYKGGSANSGTHRGRLWTSAGVKLADVTFSAETTSGWQTATLAAPIPLTAGKGYVASYLAPKGHYSLTESAFTVRKSSTYFRTPTNAGVYRYGSSGGFPRSSYMASNYFVDVFFSPTAITTSSPSPTVTATPSTPPMVTATPTSTPTPAPSAATPTSTPIPAPSAATPTLVEDFTGPWASFPYSPNEKWRIAGDWTGTGDNLLQKANASVSATTLSLTSRANSLRGAEIQTVDAAYRHGYYVVRMKTTTVPGVCQSFFWKSVNYGEPEIDFEFLTGGVTNGSPEDWVGSADRGHVRITAHPWEVFGTAGEIELGFNPSNDFHNYGFLWTPTRLVFTVDGVARASYTQLPSDLGSSAPMGYIMANTWTGAPGWGGGPPTSDATAEYEWVKYYDGVTEIPAGAG